jgi:hypothetical protein
MAVLCGVTVAAGAIEVVAAVSSSDSADVAGRVVPGAFALVFLVCAGAMWATGSVAAAVVAGVLLLIDVVGVPFYEHDSWSDRLVQGAFAVLGIVGIVACGAVLRERRAGLTAERAGS